MKTTLNPRGMQPVSSNGNTKASARSKLTVQEVENLLTFIRTHRKEYSNKTEGFKAALQATGLSAKILASSTAVHRYYAKAGLSEEIKLKRKYTRRQPGAAAEVHVNFCPNCGCNMQAVAMGIAMATNTQK